MKTTIIVRPFNEGDMKFPDFEVTFEGEPEEIIESFRDLLLNPFFRPPAYVQTAPLEDKP